MTIKLCVLCGVRPREVPDRERMGRPIKRVCRQCHGQRLIGDVRKIMKADLEGYPGIDAMDGDENRS